MNSVTSPQNCLSVQWQGFPLISLPCAVWGLSSDPKLRALAFSGENDHEVTSAMRQSKAAAMNSHETIN